MSPVRTAPDNARDPLLAIRAFDARLALAMQNADLHLLAVVRGVGARKARTRPKTVPDATQKPPRRASLRRGRHRGGVAASSPRSPKSISACPPEERGVDRLDFHELSVASIRAALQAAYAAGAASSAAKAVRA